MIWPIGLGSVVLAITEPNGFRLRLSRCAWFNNTYEQGERCLYHTASSHASCPFLLSFAGTRYGTKIRSFLHLSRIFYRSTIWHLGLFWNIWKRLEHFGILHSIFGPAIFNFRISLLCTGYIVNILRSPLMVKDYS